MLRERYFCKKCAPACVYLHVLNARFLQAFIFPCLCHFFYFCSKNLNRQTFKLMKKILFTVMLLLGSICVMAKNGYTVLKPAVTKGGNHRDVIPVGYDDDQISIRPDTIMYQAEVIVKDQKGQVMNRQRMDLVPGIDNTMSVPDTPESEKQQIEIIVDKKKYSGYLE